MVVVVVEVGGITAGAGTVVVVVVLVVVEVVVVVVDVVDVDEGIAGAGAVGGLSRGSEPLAPNAPGPSPAPTVVTTGEAALTLGASTNPARIAPNRVSRANPSIARSRPIRSSPPMKGI